MFSFVEYFMRLQQEEFTISRRIAFLQRSNGMEERKQTIQQLIEYQQKELLKNTILNLLMVPQSLLDRLGNFKQYGTSFTHELEVGGSILTIPLQLIITQWLHHMDFPVHFMVS